MKIIKTCLAAAGIAALAACGSAETDENNTMTVDNLIVNDVVTDPNMMTDMNMTTDMNATDNAVATDLTTNDADTNLANGY